MDPATLATAALTILSPFAKDAGKELVKTVGEIGFERSKGLFSWLKQKFSGDPSASKDFSRFEEDPEFAAELQKRIDEIGPMITVFQEIKKGKDVIGVEADEIHSGKVGVTQEADDVEGMTGVRVKKIG
jgi:hypothetical protein